MSSVRLPAFVVAFLCAGAVVADEAAPEINGVWMRGDRNARVRIAPCGQKICATNLWIGDTSQGENAGDKLIMTLSRNAGDSFAGTAYDPKRGWTYRITLERKGRSLFTRGCILGGLICKTVPWAEIAP